MCYDSMMKQKQPPEVFFEISENAQEYTCARVSLLMKTRRATVSGWNCVSKSYI